MTYNPLQSSIIEKGITFHRPDHYTFSRVTMDSPALEIMTDLRRVSAVTISLSESLDAAKHRMIQKGVRLLLVVDIEDHIQGLITATDILGERPMQHIQRHGGQMKDVSVADIMVPREKLEAISIKDVSASRVGDIVETLKRVQRQHALVVDHQGVGNQKTVRGIISLTQIARQMGIDVQTYEAAKTIAEIMNLMGQ